MEIFKQLDDMEAAKDEIRSVIKAMPVEAQAETATEFKASLDEKRQELCQSLDEAFSQIDTNGDGFIDRQEASPPLEALGRGDLVDRLFKLTQKESSDRISKEEMVAAIGSAYEKENAHLDEIVAEGTQVTE